MESKRAQYMRKELTHDEYYGLIVEHLGEEHLRRLLPGPQTPRQWRELIEDDQHLNNVPLRKWDAMHGCVVNLIRHTGGTEALRPINGTSGRWLSDTVCTLKTTARRYALES